MSAITIGGDLVHYEKLGRGRPVILVHGWIGSWRYWIPLMQQLHLKFSVYTLDLIGFGDSAKNVDRYSIESQVTMLEQFLDQLGISKAAFVGHGLGTLVLTEFALQNPTKVARLMLASIPLYDPGDLDERVPAGTRQLLTQRDRHSLAGKADAGNAKNNNHNDDRTVASGSSNNAGGGDKTFMNRPSNFNELPTIGTPAGIDRDKLREAAEKRRQSQKTDNPLHKQFKDTTMASLLDKCFKKSESAYDKLKSDVDKADDAVLEKSTASYDAGEMLDNLRRITAPILAVHGQDDPVLPVPDEEIWNYLTLEQEDVFVPIPLSDVRHFPMLEHDAFSQLTNDFLGTADISKIEIRDRWRRRSR